MIGSRATGGCEPCQVLTEAALSSIGGVPRGRLIGATCRVSARECPSKGWVRGFFSDRCRFFRQRSIFLQEFS